MQSLTCTVRPVVPLRNRKGRYDVLTKAMSGWPQNGTLTKHSKRNTNGVKSSTWLVTFVKSLFWMGFKVFIEKKQIFFENKLFPFELNALVTFNNVVNVNYFPRHILQVSWQKVTSPILQMIWPIMTNMLYHLYKCINVLFL